MTRRGTSTATLVLVVLMMALVAVPAAGGAGSARSRGPWRVLPDAPSALVDHTAVWDGHRVLLWGGVKESPIPGREPYREAGMEYEPGGRWRRLPAAPIEGRGHHGAVWTGREMVVWGGLAGGDEAGPRADGAAYDVGARRWRALPPGPLTARFEPIMVWTGQAILVWGGHPGESATEAVSDGALYDPAARRWRPISPAPFAAASGGGWLVPGGVLVWGWLPWQGDPGEARARAALYDPERDTWRAVPGAWPATMAPAWTGRELIVPNLDTAVPPVRDGRPILHGAYDPAADRWRPIAAGPAPMTFEQGSFAGDLALWTGKEALFWGDHAAAYDPAHDRWRYMAQAPKHCRAAPAVWTGQEMVVWGGNHGGDGYYTFGDGLAYLPAADSDPPPRATTTTGKQWDVPRQYHCGGS